MVAALHTLSFPGAIVRRGFWLYVWRVTTPKGTFHYVGRTGDNPSPKAAAPYTRMGQHLGTAPNQNALRKHLKKQGLEPDICERFDFICYGPLFPEISDPDLDHGALVEKHYPIRNIVGALEKMLAEELSNAGYNVMNVVRTKHPTDPMLWESVKAAFSADFPKLKKSKG